MMHLKCVADCNVADFINVYTVEWFKLQFNNALYLIINKCSLVKTDQLRTCVALLVWSPE